jgi:hypothetical protein
MHWRGNRGRGGKRRRRQKKGNEKLAEMLVEWRENKKKHENGSKISMTKGRLWKTLAVFCEISENLKHFVSETI